MGNRVILQPQRFEYAANASALAESQRVFVPVSLRTTLFTCYVSCALNHADI
jgi:hypothetical protein